MAVNRLTAWLRPLMTLAALAAVLSLAACGGGGGAPNNAFDSGNQTLPLAVFPNIANVYAGQPVTLAVSGGNGPFSAFSSDQSVIAVEPSVSGNTITLLPNRVTADTLVTNNGFRDGR